MITTDELIAYITKYESYVKIGNETLQRFYSVDTSPLVSRREDKIPKEGKIENMTFNFHGMGCRLEFDEVVVDFDYSFGDFVYKGFETSKLFWFITSLVHSKEKISLGELNTSLKKLEDAGIILTNDESSNDTYDYKLNS